MREEGGKEAPKPPTEWRESGIHAASKKRVVVGYNIGHDSHTNCVSYKEGYDANTNNYTQEDCDNIAKGHIVHNDRVLQNGINSVSYKAAKCT